jgi:mannose/cellobiose epimerase-like protein (N-acyl-D-glucosamine 2-epimerase family)
MVARNLFDGSWNAVLEAAGHPLRRRASWSRNESIEALRGFARKHGRTPTQNDVNSAGSTLPSWDKVTELFGSFGAGLEAAGMTPNRRRWRRDQIIDAIRAFAEEHGRPPRAADWQRATTENPHTWTVAHTFGSWPDALRAAGLVPPKLIWDRDGITDAIRAFTKAHGRPPTTADWRRRDPDGRWPNVETVARHFGSWRVGLAAAEARNGS